MSSKIYWVVLDTNVLLSKTLRDWIFLTCLETRNQFYQVYISPGINDSRLIKFAQSPEGECTLPYDIMSADNFLVQMAEFIDPRALDRVYLKQEEYLECRDLHVTVPQALRGAQAPQFAHYLQATVIPRL